MNSGDRKFAGAENGADIFDLVSLFWTRKILIGCIALACAVAAALYSLAIKPMYRAEVVLTQVTDDNMGLPSGVATQLGGLASLAGINVGLRSGGQEYKAILQSRHLIDEFIERNKLTQVLLPDSKQTSVWRATRRFQSDVLTIRDNSLKGTITVIIEWTDPKVAANWANSFVALANDTIRLRTIEEAKRNIDYLNGQIQQTSVVDLQRVMYSLIETQTKNLMLANGRTEYAFSIVDPGVSPEIRAKPQRTIITLVGLTVGVLLGICVVLCQRLVTYYKQRASPGT
jgi:LPS O-antigen subunit length determinant protein (WzzB/FepE family)